MCSRLRYWQVKGSLSNEAACLNRPKFSFKPCQTVLETKLFANRQFKNYYDVDMVVTLLKQVGVTHTVSEQVTCLFVDSSLSWLGLVGYISADEQLEDTSRVLPLHPTDV